jgi:hypothetical protein
VSEQRRRHDKIVEPQARHISPTKIPAQQNTLVMRAHTWRFALIRAAALMRGPDKKIVLVTPRAG